MKAKDLKNSILQMAVEGKLVPQDPSDEPASVLLERIREEKHRLIAEGKAKFPKGGESIIYIGSDGSPYEKRVDVKGHVLSDECIAGEVPFEKLPEGWAWARLGSVFNMQAGKNIKASLLSDEQTKKAPYPCFGGNGVRGFVAKPNAKGDHPIIGRQGALCGNVKRATGEFYATEHAVVVACFSNTNIAWACCFLTALNLNRYATATAQPGLAVSKISDVLIPIPPLPEQHRIVERMNGLMSLAEDYGRLEDAREKINAELSGRLRKSVLQMAVQGKLVPQDSADEPASALLERIREQRRELIKQKKMKAPKGGESIIFRGSDGRRYEKRIDKKGHASEPVCIEDEIPFEIPDSWEWARLEALGAIVGGGTPQTGFSEFWSDEASGVPWITPADMSAQSNILVSAGSRFISNVGLKKSSAQLLPAGSVLMSSRAPIGYLGIAANPIATNQGFKSVVLIDTTVNYWLICVLEALMDSIVKRASGTTFKEISGAEFGKTLIPLPPIGEQTRILGSCRNLSTVVTNQ